MQKPPESQINKLVTTSRVEHLARAVRRTGYAAGNLAALVDVH